MSDSSERDARIDLAREPEFSLGGLRVAPSACEVDGRRIEPRVMEVLVLLARHPNQTLSREQLIDTCWDGRSVSDDAVARVIAEIRGLARGVTPPPFTLETIRRVGYRLVVGTAQTDAGSPRPPSNRRLRVGALAAGLLALVATLAFAWRHFETTPGRGPLLISAEVARFEARRGVPPVDGLPIPIEEALHRRLTMGNVAVTPASSSFGASGVRLRIDGSVQGAGEALVSHVRLTDVATGQVLWSNRLTGRVSAPQTLAEDIAARTGDVLDCTMEYGTGHRGRLEGRTLSLLVNTCSNLAGGRPQLMLPSARLLAAQAPQLANAHGLHGIAAGLLAATLNHSDREAAALRREATAAAQRALQINPQAASAFVARELILGAGGDLVAREQDLRRALDASPGSRLARMRYAVLLRDVGRFRASIEVMKGGPSGGAVYPDVAVFLAASGDRRAADEHLAVQKVRSAQSYARARYTIGVWWDERVVAEQVIRTLGPEAASPGGQTCALKFQGVLARSGRALPAECDPLMADWRIRMLARLGNLDDAFALADQAIPPARGRTHHLFYPEMAGFRADPRFVRIAERDGLIRYWTTTGNWPDFCRDPAPPPLCPATPA